MNEFVYGVLIFVDGSFDDLYDWELMKTKIFSTLDNAIDFANAFSTDCDGEFVMQFKDGEEYTEDNWAEEKIVVEKSLDNDLPLYSIVYEIHIEKFKLDDFDF